MEYPTESLDMLVQQRSLTSRFGKYFLSPDLDKLILFRSPRVEFLSWTWWPMEVREMWTFTSRETIIPRKYYNTIQFLYLTLNWTSHRKRNYDIKSAYPGNQEQIILEAPVPGRQVSGGGDVSGGGGGGGGGGGVGVGVGGVGGGEQPSEDILLCQVLHCPLRLRELQHGWLWGWIQIIKRRKWFKFISIQHLIVMRYLFPWLLFLSSYISPASNGLLRLLFSFSVSPLERTKFLLFSL